MNRQRRPLRTRWGSPDRLLLLLTLMAGVFLMHGFQVTTSPVAASGIAPAAAVAPPRDIAPLPETAPAPGHHEAGSGAATADTAAGSAAAPAAERPCAGCGDNHGRDHEHHPGGQICLGLLVFGSILTLLLAWLRQRAPGIPAVLRMAACGRPATGRPPPRPDIYRLAVMLQ